jgi:glycosyltransferase involved in cell wall biosynthesis
MLTNIQPLVSVIIKALNEERHVAYTIESALAAIAGINGEVILADGGSSDRTIEIARRYPITIVQLSNPKDRSCGAGAQLGFQYSRGRYLMLMDGDMRLHADFPLAAIRVLRDNPGIAGVGGIVTDRGVDNQEYELRNKRHDRDRHVGLVTRLNCSGLYRRSAIESIGYLTDRNLHGAEEFDLGARLYAGGWKLVKIDRSIVDHYVHTGSAYHLLLRRIVSKIAFATGEVLRGAIGRRHFWFVIANDHNSFLCILVGAWWTVLLLTPVLLDGWAAAGTAGAILLLPFAAMSLRWRSIRLGLYSVVAWNVYALCFWPGLLASRISPTRWIDSSLVKASTPSTRGIERRANSN